MSDSNHPAERFLESVELDLGRPLENGSGELQTVVRLFYRGVSRQEVVAQIQAKHDYDTEHAPMSGRVYHGTRLPDQFQ